MNFLPVVGWVVTHLVKRPADGGSRPTLQLALLLGMGLPLLLVSSSVAGSGPAGSQRPQVLAEQRLHWADAASGVKVLGASPDLLTLGQRTFEQRCGLCHGLRGLGNGSAAAYTMTKPRDFSRAEFRLRTTSGFPTNEDLFRTITVGIPAYGMPEFGYLSVEQRWGLVHYIKQLGREGREQALLREAKWKFVEGESEQEWEDEDEEQPTLDPKYLTEPEWTDELQAKYGKELSQLQTRIPNIVDRLFTAGDLMNFGKPAVATDQGLQRGKTVYVELGCNKCHGDSARGDGPSSATLRDNLGRKILARDLTLSRWFFKGGERTSDIVRTLGTGMPGAPMPSFYLGPDHREDLWHLAQYVESLCASGDQADDSE